MAKQDKVIKTIDVVLVGPELAQQWLDTRYENERNQRTAKIDAFARDMTAGKWFFIGDPIRFDEQGRLVDGQHRLLAIVKSGTTQMFPVLGIPTEARAAIDTGTARTLGDLLNLGNFYHGRTLAAIARRLLIYRDGVQASTESSKSYVPSTPEAVEFVTQNKDSLHEAVSVAMDSARARRPIAPAVVGTGYYLAKQKDPDLAKEFFDKLIHGLDLHKGEPVLALRDRLDRELSRNGRTVHSDDAFRFLIMAWNFTRAGTSVTRLQTPRGGWHRAKTPVME